MNVYSEFKKPVNLISIGLGILGIILSIIFYVNGKKQKSISYHINSPASLVYDSKNSSPSFKLYNSDSTLIKENVYLLSGSIWNSGDFEINKNEIRRPLTIELMDSAKFLDFKIIKEKDSIANFLMKKKDSNLIQIDWDYFDPNYGFNFQLIYTGNVSPDVRIKGIFSGISEIKEVKLYNQSHKFWGWLFILQILNILVLSIKIYGARKERKADFWFYLFLFALNLYFACEHLYYYYFDTAFTI